jgi:hypothetical protein
MINSYKKPITAIMVSAGLAQSENIILDDLDLLKTASYYRG